MLQTDKVGAEEKSLSEIRSQLQLVLLDFGLAEELTPRVRKQFISFLHMISAGNGRRAAHHMLLFSTKQVHCSCDGYKFDCDFGGDDGTDLYKKGPLGLLQECRRPEAFADDMEALFNVEAQIEAPGGIDVDKVCIAK